MRMSKALNDVYYVCSLMEFIGRETKNSNGKIVEILGLPEIERQLDLAEVNHCLSFEEVATELIEEFKIPRGDFDSVGSCDYRVPTVTSIGGVYRDLIDDLKKESSKSWGELIYEVFTSFISDEISNFNASTFYENPSFIYHSYLQGELVE